MGSIRTILLAGLAAVSLFRPALAKEPLDLSLPDIGEPADQALSRADEARLGTELMRELRQQLKLVDDPAITGYLSDIGKRLAGHVSAPQQHFEFFVVDDPSINAFAMPGGYIGVNTGLIRAADTESELASVLAHEMAHITQRHIARRMLENKGTTLRTAAMVIAGILLSTQSPEAGSAAMVSGMASGAQKSLAFSRENEREADRIGEQTLAAANFNPEGMPKFFRKLMEKSRYSEEPPPFLATHPLTSERIADAENRARNLHVDHVFQSPDFPLIRNRLIAEQASDPADAVQRLRKTLGDGDGGQRAVRYGLAVALTRANRPAEAEKMLQGLMQGKGNENALLYLALAEAQLADNAPDKALESLNEGLSLFPADYALRYRRIEALIAAKEGQKALQAATDASHDFPDRTELLRLRARAADAAGNKPEAMLAMAEFYAARGDLHGALDQVDQVAKSPAADLYQKSRAEALRKNWRQDLKRQRDAQ